MRRRSSFTLALIGVAALTATACGLQSSVPQPGQTAQSPVAVNCGPGQQALIRPVVLNGQAVSQVDCVAAPVQQQGSHTTMAAYQQAPQAVPASYVTYPEPAPAPRVVERTVASPAPANVRRANYRTSGDYVEYAPRKQGRTWQKSAVIIGSTAGIGAGVGAATGGKKGALIGAAIGGGGAAIWDQVTRRDR